MVTAVSRTAYIDPLQLLQKEQRTADQERRQITALFVDMVNSTAICEQLGAESFADLLRVLHHVVTEATRGHDGFVAEYVGDGTISYFGFPQAHEDDAARAAEASFDILRTLATLAPIHQQIRLEARVGVATGEVVINRGEADYFGTTAIGSCLNKAARLQSLGQSGDAIFCATTRHLLGDMYDFTDLGMQELKGITQGGSAYRLVLQRPQGRSRFTALRSARHLSLIGREQELNTLNQALTAAESANGSAVLVHGEPGVGKSRLVAAIRNSRPTNHLRTITLQCSPLHRNTPLHPLKDFLIWEAGIQVDDEGPARRAKLQRLFTQTWNISDRHSQLVLEVLEPSDSIPPVDPGLSPPAKRNLVFELISQQLLNSGSKQRPVLLLFEDLHWLDPSSAEFFLHCLRNVRGLAATLLATTRPEGDMGRLLAYPETAPPLAPVSPDLHNSDYFQRIALTGLNDEATSAMAKELAAEFGLESLDIANIVAKADGIPLFVEEYTRMLAERGAQPNDTGIPVSLAGLVQARIDCLESSARKLAQAGAVVGRRFAIDMAANAASLPPPVIAEVQALNTADLTRTSANSNDSDYCVFKHALIRDAVYRSLNQSSRRSLHSVIADQLKQELGRQHGIEEELANHLHCAGRYAEAIDMCFAAALAAVGSGSAAEALTHLQRGQDNLCQLPEGPEQQALELKLLAVKGPTLMVTRGPGDPDFGQTQRRAAQLSKQLDCCDTALPVTYNSALHSWASGQLTEAGGWLNRLMELQDSMATDGATMAAHTMRGLIRWHQGDNDGALSDMSVTTACYQPAQHGILYQQFLKDFGVFSNFYSALAATCRGESATANTAVNQAHAIAESIQHPHERGFAHLASFMTALLQGDISNAQHWSQVAIAYSTEQGFPEFVAMAQVCLGWTQSQQNQAQQGLELMHSGAQAWDQTGFAVWQALFGALIAQVEIQQGQLKVAEKLLDRHQQRIHNMQEEQFAVPLLVARAKLCLAQNQATAAAQHYQEARSIAERQNAQLWLTHAAAPFHINYCQEPTPTI